MLVVFRTEIYPHMCLVVEVVVAKNKPDDKNEVDEEPNGSRISQYHRPQPNYFVVINYAWVFTSV